MVQRTSAFDFAPRRDVLKHQPGGEPTRRLNGRLLLGFLALGLGAAGHAQDRRLVTQPVTPAPPYCQVLRASLPALSPIAFVPPRAFDDATENSPPDTLRINQAILQCSQAAAPGFTTPAVVELSADGANVSFLAGPIVMQSGVTLLIDPGVTLYASRNANEYYNGAGGTASACGTLAASSSGCKNWVTINSGSRRRAKNIGFIGPGTIDGRGDAVITFTDGTGAQKNPNNYTWWDLAHQADLQGLNQNNPRMMQLSDVDNTLIYHINLRNSPKFHVAAQRANGFTVWGVSVFSPEGLSRNSDAFDPNGADWTITRSYISVDDDNVAIKDGTVLASGQPSAQFMTIAQNHFYTGHGMSIGNFTPTGPDVTVFDDITAPDEPPVDCSLRFVPFVAAGIPCDANGDGRIDHADIAAIGAAIGYRVYPGDPRDVDGDGVVSGRDVAACARRCAGAACAP
jgi:hypothetical protein